MKPLAVGLLTLCTMGALPVSAQRDEVGGAWELTMIRFGEPDSQRAILEVKGTGIAGRLGSWNVSGSVRGGAIEFQASAPNGKSVGTFSGTLRDGRLAGEAKIWDQPAKWTARRPVTRPARAPRTQSFTPREFHRVFSGNIAPALRIFPGDTVKTWTVDNAGLDKELAAITLGGNPVIGPFHVEGAMPGDTLVVRFNRMRPNRNSARSGNFVHSNAVTANFFRDARRIPDFDRNWRIDAERGLAFLAHPTDRLKNYSVPLRPMLGCVGVAPQGKQVYRTFDLGSFGGNLDYNRIGEGASVYLPVYHPGALLFFGDGHAAQGDGELTDAALETSMDVEFTVDVIQGKSIGMPRVTNAEYLIALGVAGSIPDALKVATTELAGWLGSEYGLNPNEVAMVLGTAIRYDIAELVDPQMNVAARISRKALAQIEKAAGK
jgi:amidase